MWRILKCMALACRSVHPSTSRLRHPSTSIVTLQNSIPTLKLLHGSKEFDQLSCNLNFWLGHKAGLSGNAGIVTANKIPRTHRHADMTSGLRCIQSSYVPMLTCLLSSLYGMPG